MRHVLVESNWVVGCFAPRPFHSKAARALLEQARKGELVLHVPSVCLTEAATVIRQKFQPRAPDWSRFREEALEEGLVTEAQNEALLRFFEVFRTTVLRDLAQLDEALDALRLTPGVDVFALNEAMLTRATRLRALSLKPFDEAILGAVLVRAELLGHGGEDESVFCTLDGDLHPRPSGGRRLTQLYAAAGLRVHGDFLPFAPTGGEAPESGPTP